jgi:hypothetical protein
MPFEMPTSADDLRDSGSQASQRKSAPEISLDSSDFTMLEVGATRRVGCPTPTSVRPVLQP